MKHKSILVIVITPIVLMTIILSSIISCVNKQNEYSEKITADLIEIQRVRDSLDCVEKEKAYQADMEKVSILKHNIDSIKTRYCKITTDKYTGRTFIESKNQPYYTNSRNYVGIYLSLDSNKYDAPGTMFLYIDYVGSDWIFWERAYFLFDNEKTTDIGIASYDRDDDVYYGGVSEVGHIALGSLEYMNSPYDKNRLDIAHMAKEAKDISVKLTGRYSKTIYCKINDFKPLCDIFFMMDQIRTINEKYKDM